MLRLGLSDIVTVQYPVANKVFVDALVEKKHQETSSFHLPVREMTITLDDVSCLMHLPMISRPFDHVPSIFSKEVVKFLLMTRLGILIEKKAIEVSIAGPKVGLAWLTDLYHQYVQLGSYVWVATTYLLHLVDSIIFADKSPTHVYIAYLLYLSNLDD